MNPYSKRLMNWNGYKQGIIVALVLIVTCLPAHAQQEQKTSAQAIGEELGFQLGVAKDGYLEFDTWGDGSGMPRASYLFVDEDSQEWLQSGAIPYTAFRIDTDSGGKYGFDYSELEIIIAEYASVADAKKAFDNNFDESYIGRQNSENKEMALQRFNEYLDNYFKDIEGDRGDRKMTKDLGCYIIDTSEPSGYDGNVRPPVIENPPPEKRNSGEEFSTFTPNTGNNYYFITKEDFYYEYLYYYQVRSEDCNLTVVNDKGESISKPGHRFFRDDWVVPSVPVSYGVTREYRYYRIANCIVCAQLYDIRDFGPGYTLKPPPDEWPEIRKKLEKMANTQSQPTEETKEMSLTLSTDKTAYAPGETARISGTVSDSNGALAGVAVSVDVSGTMLSAVTDASGNYQVGFSIPADVGLVSFPTAATATYAGYQAAIASTVFATEAALTVLLSTDKDHYLIGDTVYLTIEVKDSQGNRVGYADLDIVSTRLGSGNTSHLTGSTDATGENVWSFIWGQDASGNTITEGKLQVDVTASEEGYADGSASITLSGCGDLEKSDDEDCLDCPEDCMCGENEVCDPSGSHKNPETFCSPKMAYVFISKELGWYHEWWASDDIKQIRKFYKSKGYTVPSNIYVDQINQIATYLSRPSTKAIAYAGHGEDPGGTPTIEAAEATTGVYSVKSAINAMSRQPGGFLYTCQFETYAVKWVESKDKIETIAQGQVNHPNLDYAFMFSCYSLDDTSMRDYLLKSGGTYWGYKGKLPGNGSLTKSIKP